MSQHSPQEHFSNATPNRKRNASAAGFDSPSASFESPEHDGDDGHTPNNGKRHPVKRACNECRQQKVSPKETMISSDVLFS